MTISAADRVAILQGGKVTVGQQVDAVTARAVEQYVRAWASVRNDLVASAAEAAALAEQTGDLRNPVAYRTARLQQSLGALTVQLQRLGMLTGVEVTNLVAPVMAVPQQVLRELTVAGMPAFASVPEGELQAIVRRQQEAIASRYLVLSADAETSLRDALLRGVARGSSVDDTARHMVQQVRGAFAGGMQRALVLARTELIDASRVATTASYLAAPDVVAGWEWMATLDGRTCPACWGMHGTYHPPEVHQEGHQQCRCTQSPVLVGETPGTLGLQDRDEAFANLSRADQMQVLGPARLELYEQGVPLTAMAERRDNHGWRAGHYVTPLDRLDAPAPRAAVVPVEAPALAEREALEHVRSLVRQRMSSDEDDALAAYTGAGYMEINEALRGVRAPRASRVEAVEKTVADLQQLAGRHRLEQPVQVWRGLRDVPIPADPVGTVLQDAGFMSTSVSEDAARSFMRYDTDVALTLRVPAGTPVIPIDALEAGPGGELFISDEQELALPPGSSVRIVGEGEPDKRGRRTLVGEVFYADDGS